MEPNVPIRSLNEETLDRLEDAIEKVNCREFPYKTTLCFDGLINIIKDKAISGDHGEQLYAKMVMEQLDKVELTGPLKECEANTHQETLELLMLSIIPPALRDTILMKVSPPLSMDTLYMTPGMKRFMEEYDLNFRFTCPTNAAFSIMVANACSAILNKFYGQNIPIESPIQIIQKDKETGLTKYFKTVMNIDFINIKLLKPLKPLSKKDISDLLSDIYNTELWLKHMPPENFEFQGFAIGNLIDITEEETLSRIRYGLLEKNAVTQAFNIQELEQLVANYLGVPNLKLGITAIDYPLKNRVAHKYKIQFNFLAKQFDQLLFDSTEQSIYDQTCLKGDTLLVEDLTSVEEWTSREEALAKMGIHSIMVAPLKTKENRIVGLLELGHSEASTINGFIEFKFREIIDLFTRAVERSREEIDNQIEAVIREKYTAIHPSVEWKFIEASYNYLEKVEKGDASPVVESILFEDVYPLYGQADIVGSSTKRNNAIQADLLTNLNLAYDLLQKCSQVSSFPLVDRYTLKVEENIRSLKEVFNSNDESRLLEFFFEEIHPLFNQICSLYPELRSDIKAYFAEIDPSLGIVYQERKAYEESVTMLNNAMSNYLEQEQRKSQEIIPHYFEKYKTDGVEYDIYVGQSLLNKRRFNPMYLNNLRLLQLLNMVEVTRIVDRMQDELPVSLATAQLVFVYGSTLSIRFRMDEKQFDVDGAYNVRYEILKKRIDKALIEGTDERLTQSGKIAIVYLQEKDRLEYLDYLDYLRKRNFIEDEIEEVTLGKLQGVQGLRALRVTVKYES